MPITGLRPIIIGLNNLGQGAEMLLNRYVLGLLSAVVVRSPVDLGYFRSSWDVTTGKGGVPGVYEAVLFNNAPHASSVEYGVKPGEKPWASVGPKTILQAGRIWSSQAPEGVFGPAFEESNFDEFASSLTDMVLGGF